MPWRVDFNTEWGCIHVVYSGTITKQDVSDATAKALALARADRPNLFLTDLLDADPRLSTIDLHAIPNEWQAAGANRANKSAIVVPEDERIKEEFEKWHQKLLTTDECAFFEQFSTDNYEISCGFYAGFRAAERLAKIEVLEWFKGKYGRKENSINHCAIDAKVLQTDIDSMLSDLKGEL